MFRFPPCRLCGPPLVFALLTPLILVGAERRVPEGLLTAREAVAQALAGNFGLAGSVAALQAAEAGVNLQEAGYDVVSNVTVRLSERQNASATSGLDGAAQPQSDTRNWEAGLRKPLRTGGNVALGFNLDRSASNSSFRLLNPEHSTDFGVSWRQPLLRGAGRTVASADLIRAVSDLMVARLDLRDRALRVAADAETAYWALAAAQAKAALRRSSLEAADSVLAEADERARVGLGTELEVLQARARRAAQRQSLLVARQAVEEAEDTLMTRLGVLPESRPALVTFRVETLPADEPAPMEWSQLLGEVLAGDPGLSRVMETIDQRERDRRVAGNTIKPRLDFVASAGLLGVDGRAVDAVTSGLSRDGDRWSAGVEFSMPLGQRDGRARERAARARLAQAEADLAAYRQDLVSEVRARWRAVVLGRERLEADRASADANRRAFEQARARLASGLATVRDVLEAQSNLDVAESTLLDTQLELRRSAIILDRLAGRLLARHGLTGPLPGVSLFD